MNNLYLGMAIQALVVSGLMMFGMKVSIQQQMIAAGLFIVLGMVFK